MVKIVRTLLFLFVCWLPAQVLAQFTADRIDLYAFDTLYNPIANVEVTISNDSSYFNVGYTDANGLVTFYPDFGQFPDSYYTITFEKNEYIENLSTFSFSTPYNDGEDYFEYYFYYSADPPFAIDELTVELKTPEGDPVPNIPMDLYDISGGYFGGCYTDNSGQCLVSAFATLFSGDYTLRADVQYASDPPTGDAYLNSETSVTLSSGNATYSNTTGLYSQFESLTLDVADRALIVNVYNSVSGQPTVADTSAPVAGAYVNYYSYDDPNLYGFAVTDSSGKAYLPLSTTASGLIGVDVYGDDASSQFKELTVSAGTSDVQATFVIQTTDAEITVNVRDSDGNPVLAGTNEYSSSDTFVNCYAFDESEDYSGFPLSFYDEVTPGQSSVTVDVIGNKEYECSVYKEDGTNFFSSRVEVSSGGSASTTIKSIDADASVTIRLLDPVTLKPISGENFEVSLYVEPPEDTTEAFVPHSAFETTETGKATVELISGLTYQGYVYHFEDDSDSFVLSVGEYFTEINFTADSVQDGQTIDVVIEKLDAELTVCLRDAKGNLVSEGFAFADSPSSGDEPPDAGPGAPPVGEEEEDFSDFLHSGEDLINGCATFGIKSGRYYLVNADPFLQEPEDFGSVILPPDEIVKLEAGESKTINLSLEEPNFTLTITPDASSPFGNIDLSTLPFAGCLGERIDGRISFTTFPEGNSFNLRLSILNKNLPPTKQQPFNIICAIFIDSKSEGGIGESYFEQFTFTPKRNASAESVTVLFDDPDPFYSETSSNVNRSTANKVKIPQGEVTIPVGGISSTGNLSFSYKSPTVAPRGGKDYKVKTMLDLSPKKDGEKVSKTPKPIKVCFDVTDEDLEDSGKPFESFVVGHYNENTGRFFFPPQSRFEQEQEDGSVKRTVCISTNTFSIFSKLIDVAKEFKSQVPSTLRILKPKFVKQGGRSEKKSKKSKGKKVKAWRVKFEFPGDVNETQRFLFRYSYDSKKKCSSKEPEDLSNEMVVNGTDAFFVYGNKKKTNLCGAISVLGNGKFSTTSHRGDSRKRRSRKR